MDFFLFYVMRYFNFTMCVKSARNVIDICVLYVPVNCLS